MQKTKRKIIISGEKVHNVGYRPFLLAKAKRLRIPNYDACNIVEDKKNFLKGNFCAQSESILSDSGEKQQVIVSLEGEEKSVQDFIDFAKKNHPPKAKVSSVQDAEPPEYVMPIDEYVHLLGVEQQNTVVQAGLGMLDKQGQMLDKQDQTISEIKNGFEKMDQNFTKLDTKYDKISEKMDNIDKTLNRLVDVLSSQKSNKQ